MSFTTQQHLIQSELERELECLRASGASRQTLSLHACERLFFDLGIRPSTAAVRKLTKTGSASDIPKDINQFWENIRAVAQFPTHSDAFSKELAKKAHQLLNELFIEAKTQAQATFAHDDRQHQQTLIKATETQTEEIDELKAQLADMRQSIQQERENLQNALLHLETENKKIQAKWETEQALNRELQNRLDAQHRQIGQQTAHYEQQLKEATTEAERRVKPMLVELDQLRGMAITYQNHLQNTSQQEFDRIQQLSMAKIRSDQLQEKLDAQAEEVDRLTDELQQLRDVPNAKSAITTLVCRLAQTGRLQMDEINALGVVLDNDISIPTHCPCCQIGEPELCCIATGFELLCPECEHSSFICASKLEAVFRFTNPT